MCDVEKAKLEKGGSIKSIKDTQLLEILNIDFKGRFLQIEEKTSIYWLIYEYTLSLFAFPYKDMLATTVLTCLNILFCIFGMLICIYSDRGISFMSEDLKFQEKEIATSKCTGYKPRWNSQVERLNGILWTTIDLSLKSRVLSVHLQEAVLSDAIHSICYNSGKEWTLE